MLPASYLVITQSGRSLAESARKGNCPVHVIDHFADSDTCTEAASVTRVPFAGGLFDENILIRTVREKCLEQPGIELVTGSGFEKKPALLQTLSRLAPCLGNPANIVQKVKDPVTFFGLLEDLDIPHPATTVVKKETGNDWLCKMTGGMGGDHIYFLKRGASRTRAGSYYQQFIEGQSCSVVFLADGRQARVVGYNEIWHAREFVDTPFKYGGAIKIAMLPGSLAGLLESIISRLVAATGLKGLCGIDFVLDRENHPYVIEINPRPPATFELHECGKSLFMAHVNACHGLLPDEDIETDDLIRGCMVLYARHTLSVPMQLEWPTWSSDRPGPGRKISHAEPVCTIHATGQDQASVRKLLSDRRFATEAELMRWQNAA